MWTSVPCLAALQVIELQRRFDGKKIVLGIDRMDYIKGIPHKLLAIDKFLSAHPSWAGKIQLVQIATPIMRGDTARYVKLRNKVHKLVGQINGRFSTLAHAPIHYLDQPISPCDVAALCFLAGTCRASLPRTRLVFTPQLSIGGRDDDHVAARGDERERLRVRGLPAAQPRSAHPLRVCRLCADARLGRHPRHNLATVRSQGMEDTSTG